MIPRAVTTVLLTVSIGCAPKVAHDTGRTAAEPVRWPSERYAALADAGEPVYRVRPAASTVRLYIYRAGPMAGMGHNHIARLTRLRGAVHLPEEGAAGARFDVVFRAQDLVLDEPRERRRAGPRFAESLGDEAVRRTRENMLGPEVLNAGGHPRIGIRSVAIRGRLPVIEAEVAITVAGRRAEHRIPLYVTLDGERLCVRGQFRIAQTALGIQPFSVAGGALRVADTLGVRFELIAERD